MRKVAQSLRCAGGMTLVFVILSYNKVYKPWPFLNMYMKFVSNDGTMRA
jgi:hypothetical protein